jgi:hypothetical protein
MASRRFTGCPAAMRAGWCTHAEPGTQATGASRSAAATGRGGNSVISLSSSSSARSAVSGPPTSPSTTRAGWGTLSGPRTVIPATASPRPRHARRSAPAARPAGIPTCTGTARQARLRGRPRSPPPAPAAAPPAFPPLALRRGSALGRLLRHRDRVPVTVHRPVEHDRHRLLRAVLPAPPSSRSTTGTLNPALPSADLVPVTFSTTVIDSTGNWMSEPAPAARATSSSSRSNPIASASPRPSTRLPAPNPALSSPYRTVDPARPSS